METLALLYVGFFLVIFAAAWLFVQVCWGFYVAWVYKHPLTKDQEVRELERIYRK